MCFRRRRRTAKSSEAELMQYRRPVGLGPSSNTCPRWARSSSTITSVRTLNRLRSGFVSMTPPRPAPRSSAIHSPSHTWYRSRRVPPRTPHIGRCRPSLVSQIFARERLFGPGLLRDVILQRRQLLEKLIFVGFAHNPRGYPPCRAAVTIPLRTHQPPARVRNRRRRTERR